MRKKCYIIAGPNGAGKTTFANEFLPREAACLNFINADLIAKGLSPFQPEKAAIAAGKIMIHQMNDYIAKSKSFAFETTLSGRNFAGKIRDWKSRNYEIIIYYLKLPSVELAIERVKLRVARGGHNVPEHVIRRRYSRSWENFQQIYKPLADSWIIFDTSGQLPVIIEESRSIHGKTQ